jgi:hypothetical protein
VWADLRAGLLDLRGFSPATRSLVVIGFGLLFLMVGVLLNNEPLRRTSGLIPMTVGTPGRGSLVPTLLLPLSMFLLSMAWSFVLAGALHSHRAICVGVLLLYLFFAVAWIGIGITGSQTSPNVLGGLAGLVGVLAFFGLRWRARPRPAAEYAVLLVLVAATTALAQARAVDSWRTSGIPVAVATLHANLLSMGSLIVPFLLLIGVSIADFARRAAGWVADIAEDSLPGRFVLVGLVGVAAWRLRELAAQVGTRLAGSSPQAELVAYLGALSIPLTVWLVWWVVDRAHRRRSDDPITADDIGEAAGAFAPKLIVAFQSVSVVTVILYSVALGLASLFAISRFAETRAFIAWIYSLSVHMDTVQSLVPLVALLAAYPLARRGRAGLALYLGAFGARGVWLWLTAPGRPLSALQWEGSDVVMHWWTLTFVLFGLAWLVRRQLTAERAGRLIFLLLIVALLEQTDFISNPFSPFFSFAGIGFIAFGIVWDAVTIGAWANRETPGLPRVSRIFLYLGYVLLTVTLINWVLQSHDLKEQSRLTGEIALNGMHLFGKPMLYAIFAATLMLPARTQAGTATGDED